MAIENKKLKMYEPWGYQEENNYQSEENLFDIELDKMFVSAEYDKDDRKIHFFNNDGEELSSSTIDTTEFASGVVVDAYYDSTTKELVIEFDGGSVVRINMAEIIDENEFSDGLQVDSDGIVSVKIDSDSDPYLTVGANGVKLSGVENAIEAEKTRAISAETKLENAINDKVASAETAINDEVARAKAAEEVLESKIDDEIARAKSAETAIDEAAVFSAEYDSENKLIVFYNKNNESIDSIDATPFLKDGMIDSIYIDHETNELVIVWNTESGKQETRIPLSDIFNPDNYYTKTEVDDIISGSTEKLDKLIEKLGYKDNDTLETSNEFEVAFGKYNITNTDVNPSGKTIFSIGIGVSESERKNALEVRENGDVYMWVEGDYLQINDLLGMLAHETYDD